MLIYAIIIESRGNYMTVRKCLEKDVEEIHILLNELENTTFSLKTFTTIYLDKIVNPNNHYFVYCIDNKIVGFISLNIEQKLHHHDKVCTIEELVIHPEYRNQKIGGKLLTHGINTAKDNNCEIIELTSNIRRTKAHSFYLQHGFTKDSYKFSRKL